MLYVMGCLWIGGWFCDGRTGISIHLIGALFAVFLFSSLFGGCQTQIPEGAFEPLCRVIDSSVSWHVFGGPAPY